VISPFHKFFSSIFRLFFFSLSPHPNPQLPRPPLRFSVLLFVFPFFFLFPFYLFNPVAISLPPAMDFFFTVITSTAVSGDDSQNSSSPSDWDFQDTVVNPTFCVIA